MGDRKFPVIPADRANDLHNLEIADSADLILFMAGNQFMVMKEIVSAFKNEYPDIEKTNFLQARQKSPKRKV